MAQITRRIRSTESDDREERRWEKILSLFERPEQLLSFLSGRRPEEIPGSTLMMEVRDAEKDPFFLALTTYIQERDGDRRGYVTYVSFQGITWMEPNHRPILLPNWLSLLWGTLPAEVSPERTPVYVLQRAVAHWIENLRAKENQPAT